MLEKEKIKRTQEPKVQGPWRLRKGARALSQHRSMHLILEQSVYQRATEYYHPVSLFVTCFPSVYLEVMLQCKVGGSQCYNVGKLTLAMCFGL